MNKQEIDTMLLVAGAGCIRPRWMRDPEDVIKWLDPEQVFGVKNDAEHTYRCDYHLDVDENIVGIMLEVTVLCYYHGEEFWSTYYVDELPLTKEEVRLFTEECLRLF